MQVVTANNVMHTVTPHSAEHKAAEYTYLATATLRRQVHDEVILEGPEASADQAKALVVRNMAHPWAWTTGDNKEQQLEQVQPLRVKLEVDANTADTWYDAK